MRLALCQVNPVVGDVDANADLCAAWAERAAAAGADLAVFPEQAIAGYPAEDLLLRRGFLDHCTAAMESLATRIALPALVGGPEQGGDTFNAAWVLAAGAVRAVYRKHRLPNYGVFDEHRWFRAGSEAMVLEVPVHGHARPARVGVTVCEDIWLPTGPAQDEAAAGAEVIVNLSASPYRRSRGLDRERLLAGRAIDSGAWIALCNMVGGQDELVFDGGSLVVAPDGEVVARGTQFVEDLLVVDLDLERGAAIRLREARHRDATPPGAVRTVSLVGIGAEARTSTGDDRDSVPPVGAAGVEAALGVEAEVWGALRLGLGDYVRKNGFTSVVLGLSGGIDSALVLALAVDELGANAVHAATMPSRYSSDGTRGDAHEIARMLGVSLLEIPIEPIVQAFDDALAGTFGDAPPDVTQENLQARTRGVLLMALSNRFGRLVLTTGNKSELAVGYATLHGDMAGGFAPLKDVPKTLVWRLARWRNEVAEQAGEGPRIPWSTITRPPSAELRADQRDDESLPDYAVLDAVLELLVDEDRSVDDIVAAGHDRDLVVRVRALVDGAEHKRRQAPPGVRISAKAFGRDRRMPITNGHGA